MKIFGLHSELNSNRRSRVLVGVAWVCSILAWSRPLAAADYFVRQSGNDRNGGTSASDAWRSLGQAFSAGPGPGDTVYVGAGTYSESIAASNAGIGGTSSNAGNGSSNSNSGSSNNGRKARANRRYRSSGNGNSNRGNDNRGNDNRGNDNRGNDNSGNGNSGNGNSGSGNSGSGNPLQFVADLTGQYTRDRGAVIIVPAGNRWALELTTPGEINFTSFQFGLAPGSALGYGVRVSGGSAVTFFDCEFQNLSTGLRCDSGSDVELDGGKVTANDYGIYATGASSLGIDGVAATENKSWAIYATADELAVSDCSVTNGGNGVFLEATNASRDAEVYGTTISGHVGYGLVLSATSLVPVTDRNLAITGNGSAGLSVTGTTLTLTSDSGIELTGNGVGVYVTQGDVLLTGITLSRNTTGIYQSSGKLSCTNCTITGGSTGIRQDDGTGCTLSGVTVTQASSWGVYLSTANLPLQPVSLSQVTVSDSGNGVYTELPTGATLTVDRSTFRNNVAYGFVSYRASATVTDSESSGNGSVAIYHIDGPLTVERTSVTNNTGYGIWNSGSALPLATRLEATGCRVSGNAAGIGSWNAASSRITNNVVTGNAFGIVTNQRATGGSIWNNTLSDNGTGVWHAGGVATFKNNIISIGDLAAENTTGYGLYVTAGALTHSHNLLFGQSQPYFGTTRGTGETIKPPRFVDYQAGNFRLSKGSPAINAGTATGLSLSVDLSGVARSTFGAPEIGAFEYNDQNGSLRIVDWKELATPPQTGGLTGNSPGSGNLPIQNIVTGSTALTGSTGGTGLKNSTSLNNLP